MKRGEFQKLAEQYKGERDERDKKIAEYEAKLAEERKSTEAKIADANKNVETKLSEFTQQQRAEKVRRTLDAFYVAAGGTNADLFRMVSEKFITDGTVKVGDDGTSIVGASEVIRKIIEAYPPLFKGSQQEVLKRVAAAIPGGTQAAADAAIALREQKAKQRQGQSWTPLAESYAANATADKR